VARILIIEDDDSIRTGLVDTLESKGHQVRAAARGREGLRCFAEEVPELVILDLMLPDLGGFEVCRQLKTPAHPDVPVIILTARGDELDRVRGLELGADDYVTKPFSLMELLARINAVLRRLQRHRSQPGELRELRFNTVHVDFLRHEATKAGKKLELTDQAFAVLRVFARHRGEVVSREQLLEEAWGAKELNTRTVDNHIVKIRKQIEDDPNAPRLLITVHGVGYKLAV